METLSLPQAAAFLNVHQDTLRAMARQGTVPCAKFGRGYVFLMEDLVLAIRSQYGTRKEKCHSSSEVPYIGLTSVTAESVSAKLRAHRTKRSRKGSTTK